VCHIAGGSGDVNVKSHCGEIKVTNVMYVPFLKYSLVYVGLLVDEGHVIMFMDKKCLIVDNIWNKDTVAK